MNWAQQEADAKQLHDARVAYPDAPSDRCAVAAFAGMEHAASVFNHGHIGLAEHRWLHALLRSHLGPSKRFKHKWRNWWLRPLRDVDPTPPEQERALAASLAEPKGHMAELADGWMPDWVKVPT